MHAIHDLFESTLKYTTVQSDNGLRISQQNEQSLIVCQYTKTQHSLRRYGISSMASHLINKIKEYRQKQASQDLMESEKTLNSKLQESVVIEIDQDETQEESVQLLPYISGHQPASEDYQEFCSGIQVISCLAPELITEQVRQNLFQRASKIYCIPRSENQEKLVAIKQTTQTNYQSFIQKEGYLPENSNLRHLAHPMTALNQNRYRYSNHYTSNGKPLREFWTKQTEIMLINAYINLQTMKDICDYMTMKYPILLNVLSPTLVRSRIVCLMRQGLKKLAFANSMDTSGPRLHTINYDTAKIVIDSSGNKDIKVRLLKMYIEDKMEVSLARDTVLRANSIINNGLLTKRQRDHEKDLKLARMAQLIAPQGPYHP